MALSGVHFATSVFSVEINGLAPHCNPVPCVIMGLRKSISVMGRNECVSGDILFIRPGAEHRVMCANDGIVAMYLDGLKWPGEAALARPVEGALAQAAMAAFRRHPDADGELRSRLTPHTEPLPPKLGAVIDDLIADPMTRMTQLDLARRLQMERTAALRAFKAATGQTFRQFKQWSALQHAARQIATGELVRTAAMDAGFADTAHLSRTFRASFGLSPSEAIAGQAQAAP